MTVQTIVERGHPLKAGSTGLPIEDYKGFVVAKPLKGILDGVCVCWPTKW